MEDMDTDTLTIEHLDFLVLQVKKAKIQEEFLHPFIKDSQHRMLASKYNSVAKIFNFIRISLKDQSFNQLREREKEDEQLVQDVGKRILSIWVRFYYILHNTDSPRLQISSNNLEENIGRETLMEENILCRHIQNEPNIDPRSNIFNSPWEKTIKYIFESTLCQLQDFWVSDDTQMLEILGRICPFHKNTLQECSWFQEIEKLQR